MDTRSEFDDSQNPTNVAPDANASAGDSDQYGADGAASGDGDKSKSAGREMLVQLQQMIDTLTTQAGPVMREVAAKSAELAAIAGEKAGPLAYKAAEVTQSVGQRVATRSKEYAADLRRPTGEGSETAEAGPETTESGDAGADNSN